MQFSHIDENEQFDDQELKYSVDFLLDEIDNDESLYQSKRKPRSSLESSEREAIPSCRPAYISRHMRDGGRAYEPIESFSPQPVQRKPLFQLGSFMDNDTFEEDVDFLFKDHQPRATRERFCSDTNFSSHMPDDRSSQQDQNRSGDSQN